METEKPMHDVKVKVPYSPENLMGWTGNFIRKQWKITDFFFFVCVYLQSLQSSNSHLLQTFSAFLAWIWSVKT